MRKDGAGNYILSTGRVIDVNDGILGIGAERAEGLLRIFGGYDSPVLADEPDYVNDAPRRADAFSAEEKAEIAEYMIGLWRRWAEQA